MAFGDTCKYLSYQTLKVQYLHETKIIGVQVVRLTFLFFQWIYYNCAHYFSCCSHDILKVKVKIS